MSESPKKFYLTTPIYYVNARPHIGHAYSTIAADVIARRHRLLGDDTFFLTGTDEHGQKVQRSAEKAGIPPQQFADQVSKTFSDLWARMGMTNDDYIRTTDERHKRGVQKLWKHLEERGAIYLSSYTGQYSVGEEMFIDGPPGTIGPDGKPTETVTEENYFFKLSEYQLPVINLIESGELHIQPETTRNEVLSFLRGNVAAELTQVYDREPPRLDAEDPQKIAENEGKVARSTAGHNYVPGALKDLSISRTTFNWGIPVPGNEKHVIYVWLDALANYMTAVGYGSDDPAEIAKFEKYWPADLHLVGKEITRFHCVYWPAFLLAAGLPLPKSVVANGWLLFEDSKMSKSRGNVVRTETILDAFGSLLPKPAPTTADTGVSPADIKNNTADEKNQPANERINKADNGISSGLQPTESTPTQTGALAPGISDEAWKRQQDLFASDVIRYFLLREIPFGQDGSFSFDALVQRYNSDLANGYGNLVSRTLNLIVQYCSSTYVYGRRSGAAIPPLRTIENAAYLQFSPQLRELAEATEQASERNLGAFEFGKALETIWNLVARTDAFISETAPWKLLKEISSAENTESYDQLTDQHGKALIRLEDILYTASESIRIITALLYPFLPNTTAKVWKQLGFETHIEQAARNGELKNLKWGGLKPGTKLGTLAPIFPRAPKELIQTMTDAESNNTPVPTPSKFIDEKTTHTSPITEDPTHPAAPPRAISPDAATPSVGGSHAITTERPDTPSHTEAPASGVFANAAAQSDIPDTPQIAIDDFVKIDLRVAQIVVAERIPKADKLLRLEVDLGYEKRQILSGIAEWYTPEDLLGRRIVIIANLAPRKMRGLESHGMLLAASHGENGKPVLATFGEDIALGSRLR